MADIVLWDPAYFGVKAKIVFKGGFIAYAMMGDPNASVPPVQPVFFRPMFGSFGLARSRTSVIFTSKLAIELGIEEKYGMERKFLPVGNTRTIGKQQLVRNDTLGEIEIDPETYKVTFNGKPVSSDPAKELPMTQLYHLI